MDPSGVTYAYAKAARSKGAEISLRNRVVDTVLRADGGGPVSIVDADTGSLLGTMDSPQTHYQAHTGAVYVHQGDSYVVEELNEDEHCVPRPKGPMLEPPPHQSRSTAPALPPAARLAAQVSASSSANCTTVTAAA